MDWILAGGVSVDLVELRYLQTGLIYFAYMLHSPVLLLGQWRCDIPLQIVSAQPC